MMKRGLLVRSSSQTQGNSGILYRGGVDPLPLGIMAYAGHRQVVAPVATLLLNVCTTHLFLAHEI